MNVHLLNDLIWRMAEELGVRHGYTLIDNDEGMLTLRKQEGVRVTYLFLLPLYYGDTPEAQQELIRSQLQESVDWMKTFGRRKSALVHRKIHLYIRTSPGLQTPLEELAKLSVSSVTEQYRAEAWVADPGLHRLFASDMRVTGSEALERILAELIPAEYELGALNAAIERRHYAIVRAHEERLRRPREEIAGRRKGSPVTFALTGINVAVWLLMTAYGGSDNPETLVRFGAKYNPYIDRGEYWRWITPIFLHIGGLHLWFNSTALLSLGGRLERGIGSLRFALFYLLAGIAGNIASYTFSPSISAGASGAIFGLMGVLLVLSIMDPDLWGESGGMAIWGGLGMNVVLGFIVPGIDNYAHFGGLAAGAAAGWVYVTLQRAKTAAR
ncbi:hypothetical protein PM3016_4963 [Paenibacillus mucilaginosus 3016]|uniref:Peptidase S54 rhomboid domain-containing protein n=1 Tax=Paenibacillus mucilaginosus 3016 TaxID=1116391 RepID=H6NLY0_9BACL|nr:rhomboid family intramembrane serine protease [Paenibacillus mucilaginosus]AFC31695.1 hypothetical protein PM3016_4963 [Paenibacillus mucilaginosus 3016]WFA20225.1 rhomboid family intramembrane serine protease [Paenibacillus mucilaginosus]